MRDGRELNDEGWWEVNNKGMTRPSPHESLLVGWIAFYICHVHSIPCKRPVATSLYLVYNYLKNYATGNWTGPQPLV